MSTTFSSENLTIPPFEICSLQIGYPGIPKSINLSWSSIAYLRESTKKNLPNLQKYPKTPDPFVLKNNAPQRLPRSPSAVAIAVGAVVLVALGRFTHHHDGLAGEILPQVLRQRRRALRRDQVAFGEGGNDGLEKMVGFHGKNHL